MVLCLLWSGSAYAENVKYFCKDIKSNPANHSWFGNGGSLEVKQIGESYKYNINAGNNSFNATKASGAIVGNLINKYGQINFIFYPDSKNGNIVIVGMGNSAPVDINFNCQKKNWWNLFN